MDDLLELKSTFPNAKLVVGNTEIGIEKFAEYSNHKFIDVLHF